MGFFSKSRGAGEPSDDLDLANAVRQSQMVVCFDPQGIVQEANAPFLNMMGYALADVVGKPHAMFMGREDAASADYKAFWSNLRSGRPYVGVVRRVRSDGSDVWLKASYMPVMDGNGAVRRILKNATDATERVVKGAEQTSMIDAINRSNAVIEFDLTGKILGANANFLAATGYDLNEIVGRHHSMFVEPSYAASVEYGRFWTRLAAGEFISGEFLRRGKGGREVWLSASYNAVFDARQRPVKVVKFAMDITEKQTAAVDAAGQLAALGRSQAVIEFDMAGKVLGANENFLKVVGYELAEIAGRTHDMFVPAHERESAGHREAWAALREGRFQSGEYLLIGKGGREVWIQATYNPILGTDGRPVKVVTFATDITPRRRAVTAFQQAMSRLSEGDLTHTLDSPFADEFEALRTDYNMACARLSEVVGDMISASGNVNSGASEIAQASDDLSRRTETQAATLEETAAALDELTTSVKSAAGSAGAADEAVKEAGRRAEESGSIMRQATEAMGEIEKSSSHISQIIGVIDDIAFQTNLLALNAGVEAARAGDAGRGFAVVASEVRSLAQRSADAAKEIKTLISNSTGHVSRGVGLVGQAGSALGEIVRSVNQVAGLVSTIASSAVEQANGLSEISTGVNQLDQVTQQNAAMVEQATAAAHSLRQEAQSLSRAVAAFRIAGGKAAAAPSRGAAPSGRARPAPPTAATRAQPQARASGDWQDF
jgi:methyl-accepting chemotaxis protein